MRIDPMQLVGEEIRTLAENYAMTIVFDVAGFGQVASVLDALSTLAELIASDDRKSALEKMPPS